jgi:energy-coupling factor transporter ATP-binding protein EcfA2
MPADLLQTCRAHLEKNYREKLGTGFSDSVADLEKARQPVWRFVAASDLTTEMQPGGEGVAGLLLDPEIGLLFYLLPFDAEANIRQQIVRALALRSQLSTERNYTGQPTAESDARGAWRVVVHWLVCHGAREKWIAQIMDVRRETAFSEELSLDAIFLDNGEVEPHLAAHGFPRLLLTTREVFKKQRLDEMTRWLSANDLVARALENFEATFRNTEQREMAAEIVRAMQDFRSRPRTNGTDEQPPETPGTLRSIRVRDFRNLSDVSLDFGIDSVSTRVIHGPNGTGKSSLAEAISLALFHSSLRYKMFADRAREKDVTVTDRAREYFEKYLTVIDLDQRHRTEPKIAIDGDTFIRPQLVDGEKIQQADLAMGGTILTQDTSVEFARMPSAELGARVLRGYSDLADHVEDFTESRVTQANAARQDFLRRQALPASITKLDTVYPRIAKHEINQSLPAFPFPLVMWLEHLANLRVESASDLPGRWRAWGDDASRDALAQEIAGTTNDVDKIQRTVREWLEQFNALVVRTGEFLKGIEARLDPIRSELGEHATARIMAWSEWLDKRAQSANAAVSPEADALAKKLREMQTRQQQVIERGRTAGVHFEHLVQVEAFVRETWAKQHADDCPTCGANHAEHGGILKVIESLRARTAAEREKLRDDYGTLKTQMEQAQKQLAALGQAQCPLSAEDQSRLADALQWLVPEGVDFSRWIVNQSQRDELIASLAMLRQMPTVPVHVNAESEAERVTQDVLSQFRNAEKTFEAPNNWKPVKNKLTEALAAIVKEHLPSTLARLWCELTLNLTAAPWLLPERPCIDVITRRGEQKSTIRVKGRLARYILNQSELHILGLAWFFTRYLTHGRFFHACMVMDDPAQELDQTSFRDLCRLWETWVRLHRVYNRPLKLVIMLNQESRALEAARATGGILAVLGWIREQEESMRAISVIGEGFHAPQPARLFEKAAS